MTTLTVTAKGQVTLRKEILEHLGAAPGTRLEVVTLPDGRVEMRAAKRIGSIKDIFGLLSRPGQPTLTVEEMNEIIADGWAGKL